MISVMAMGSRLTVTPPSRSILSGSARSQILSGGKAAPCKIVRFDRKLYAAMKNGICSSRDSEPRST